MINYIHQGQVIEGLQQFPDKFFHTCVTSPPYYGLRDYGVDGQIGLEQTPEEFIQKLVEVFRVVRDKLRDDGCIWVNIGDSYAAGKTGRADQQDFYFRNHGYRSKCFNTEKTRKIPAGLKPKDLIGIPWMLAFALRADGWYLRQDIIWHKPNPMPESAKDRCTKAHEYIFLLSKSHRYYYDHEAIKQDAVQDEVANTFRGGSYVGGNLNNSEGNKRKVKGNKKIPSGWDTGEGSHGAFHRDGRQPVKSGNKQRKPASERGVPEGAGKNQAGSVPWEGLKANKRSVWTVATMPYKEAHFATFPEKLIIDCIKAGSSEKGCCKSCGSPWKRIVEDVIKIDHTGESDTKYDEKSTAGRLAKLRQAAREQGMEYNGQKTTTGWEPTCKCKDNEPMPCNILDPFMGAGTTAVVAKALGRNYGGCELNPEYMKIIDKRLRQEFGMFHQ